MLMEIHKAGKEDRDFILHAHKEILKSSGLIQSDLEENIDKDILDECEECKCLIVESDDKKVAMCLYSNIYWADSGNGIYLSQIYVEPEYRGKGIVQNLFAKVFEDEPDANFITLLVGKENACMQKVMHNINAKMHDLFTYEIRRECLIKE